MLEIKENNIEKNILICIFFISIEKVALDLDKIRSILFVTISIDD